jgi:hypothetical protein
MTEYANIRNNTVSGYYKTENETTHDMDVVFNEWWCGEGLDIIFQHESPATIYSFNSSELHTIASIALATGMIDIEEVLKTAKKLASVETNYNERNDHDI